jgi:hypothetical protein
MNHEVEVVVEFVVIVIVGVKQELKALDGVVEDDPKDGLEL